jgi:hypothetical protein
VGFRGGARHGSAGAGCSGGLHARVGCGGQPSPVAAVKTFLVSSEFFLGDLGV